MDDKELLEAVMKAAIDADVEPAERLPQPTPLGDDYAQLAMDVAESGLELSEQFMDDMMASAVPVPVSEQLIEIDYFAENQYIYNWLTFERPADTLDTEPFISGIAIPCSSFSAQAQAQVAPAAVQQPPPIVTPDDAQETAVAVYNVEQSIADGGNTPRSVMSSSESDEDNEITLNLTHCVRIWKRWVQLANAQPDRYRRSAWPEDFLQLGPESLSYALCRFVITVRRTNGEQYAPDTIYYLLMGIQRILLDNGRLENFWSDKRYEGFVRCFDELAKRKNLEVLLPCYIPIRVTEEHLWLSKQFGTHSPVDLLTTLIFFNTIYFHLHTKEQHMSLKFFHISKKWDKVTKRAFKTNAPVSLRYSAPSPEPGGMRVHYDASQNVEFPGRCPVLHYDFYLLKAPRFMQNSDSIYYLQPERTYTASSPIWFSKQPISDELFDSIMRRLMMVLEIERLLYKDKN